MTSEEQELDIHSFIHHLRKGGQSNMYQCNIVSGDSHCVFKGRMKLEPRAREVKADQLIRSIMLTDSCTVDAMPTLEVCSGDVDCTHGATVADIDENEAFYLQSRGIGRREVHTSTLVVLCGTVCCVPGGNLGAEPSPSSLPSLHPLDSTQVHPHTRPNPSFPPQNSPNPTQNTTGAAGAHDGLRRAGLQPGPLLQDARAPGAAPLRRLPRGGPPEGLSVPVGLRGRG